MDGATAIEDVFLAALELPPGERRERYLDGACKGDVGIRRRVDRLLEAHPKAGSFLEQPASMTAVHHPGAEKQGTVVADRYKLLELVGEGGMGAVWVAEQTNPVRRKVALKVIKPGMDSKSVLARFEAERQALALMDHPNIAKVLDGGVTEHGRPFFVMDYVKGTPITEYCDKACLSVAERLRLFVHVCDAVQHAHQKGVIHRDLKPSNILVAPYDDRPVPKIIDFGLAKALHQPLIERTLFTAHGVVLGTPLYMSPEQAQLNNLDVDTRADVYSLGVLLYELLTGTTPLEKQRFQKAAWDEVQRIIRDEEPARPSTRLSTAEMLPTLAACRQTEPAALAKVVSGDLDWITMKCLEKDRARRYESADGLARDLQRYLGDEPIEARPPSTAYRLRKFAKKHRAALAAAAAFALLLVAGTTVSVWQAVRATNAERSARASAEAEKEASEQAQKRLSQIEKSNEIIASIFADLDVRRAKASGEPLQAALAGRLLKAAEQLEGEAIGDPVTVARLQQRLGQSLLHLGHSQAAVPLFDKARTTLERALGADHPDTIATTGNLAIGYEAVGKTDVALPLYEEALKRRTARLGLDHPDTLTAMNNLAEGRRSAGKLDAALPLFEQAWKLSKSKLGADHPDTLVSLGNLASGYAAAGKLAAALPLYEQALKLNKTRLGPDHPDTLTAMNNLADGYRAVGRLDRAVPLLEESHRRCKARLGSDHPETLISAGNLAAGYRQIGKTDLALPLDEETLKRTRARQGADHPATLIALNNLAADYLAAGKAELALPLLEEALKHRTDKLGLEHPDTLAAMNNLAAGYHAARKADRALPLFEKSLRLRKAKLGTDHPDTLTSMSNLAAAYQSAGKLDQAAPILEETLELRKAKLGSDHPETLISLNNLAGVYVAAGKLGSALPLFEQAATVLEKRQFRHEYAERIMTNAIGAFEKAKQRDKAEGWRRKWLAASAPTTRGGAAP